MGTGPAYRILTQRLLLRCWTPDDAGLLQAAIAESLDHLKAWLPWAKNEPEDIRVKIDRLRRFQTDFERGRDFVYGIFSPNESKVLGGTGLHTRLGPTRREIGYWIHKDHINRGLATESTAALTKVAFDIDRVPHVEIRCDPDNLPSASIPKKLGFCRRPDIEINDEGDRKMVWTMSPEQYAAR